MTLNDNTKWHHAECLFWWVSQISLLFWVSLCWGPSCWMAVCWMSWRRVFVWSLANLSSLMYYLRIRPGACHIRVWVWKVLHLGKLRQGILTQRSRYLETIGKLGFKGMPGPRHSSLIDRVVSDEEKMLNNMVTKSSVDHVIKLFFAFHSPVQ